jgi:hypothetical protein
LPTALPQTLMGAFTGACTWLPPRMLWWPEVRPPMPPPPALATLAPPRQPASASPITAALLPQMLTGALIGAWIWLPPPMLCAPEVR